MVDIKQALIVYKWVKLHQDRYKLWRQLTLTQQLDCMCDTLTKRAIVDSLESQARRIDKQSLPCESACIFVGGIKQTTGVSKYVRFVLGHIDVENFYTTPLGRMDVQGNRNTRSSWWDRYCLRKVTLLPPPSVLLAVWGFLRGALVEVLRAWILLRGRGVLGTGPGSPGNPCFPTHSCGSCRGEVVLEALSVLAGDIYSGERS